MDKIEHLEYLSKLEFTGEEKENFKKEFENILKVCSKIVKRDWCVFIKTFWKF